MHHVAVKLNWQLYFGCASNFSWAFVMSQQQVFGPCLDDYVSAQVGGQLRYLGTQGSSLCAVRLCLERRNSDQGLQGSSSDGLVQVPAAP